MVKRLSVFALTIASTFAIPIQPAQANIGAIYQTCANSKMIQIELGTSIAPGTVGGEIARETFNSVMEQTGMLMRVSQSGWVDLWTKMKSLSSTNAICNSLY